MMLLSATDVLEMEPFKIVLTNHSTSFISWRIRKRTHGYYNHAMVLVAPGICASQELWYKQDMLVNRIGNYRIKFWYNPAWTRPQQDAAIRLAFKRLALPWYRTRYDWVGVVGQWLPGNFTRRFNLPWRRYCSEDAGLLLELLEPTFKIKHPSPADINRWCKDNHQMICAGVYDPDLNGSV